MGHEGIIPSEVREAQRKGDHRRLSAMGRAGNKTAADNRLIREEQIRLDTAERVQELALNESLSPDGQDVLPRADINPADQITYPHH